MNTPLMADYLAEKSMARAIALSGVVSTLASVFAIAGLFRWTKSLDCRYSMSIVGAVCLTLGTISVLVLNPKMEKKQVKK